MRICTRHGRAVFRLDTRATYRCILCAQERVAERRRRIKRILVEEAGGCCAVCGYDRCIINLHFHHVDPATKAFTMRVASGKGLAKLRAERRSACWSARTATAR